MARILIVDETLARRESLEALVRAAGHEVQGFDGPRPAVHAMREARPAVVITADGGEGWDGFELLEAVAVVAEGTPVVWFGQRRQSYGGHKVAGFLSTPFQGGLVQALLTKVLGGPPPGSWEGLDFLHSIDGSVFEYPPLRVLELAGRAKATGCLEVLTERGAMSLHLVSGRVGYATGIANLLKYAGLESGPDADFASLIASAVAKGIGPDVALNIAADGIGQAWAELFESDAGTVRFLAGAAPPSRPVIIQVLVMRIIASGLRASRPFERVAPLYERKLDHALHFHLPTGARPEDLGLDPVAFRLIRRTRSGARLGDVWKAETDKAGLVAALDLLRAVGFLRFGDALPKSRSEDTTTEEIRPLRADDTLDTTFDHMKHAPPAASPSSTPTASPPPQAAPPAAAAPKKPKAPVKDEATELKLAELEKARQRFKTTHATEIFGLTKILDLQPDALNRAYRNASAGYHPDRYVNEPKAVANLAADCFALLHDAYTRLQTDKGVEDAKRRLKAMERGEKFVTDLDQAKARVAFTAGENHARHHNDEKAMASFEEAMSLDPKPWRYRFAFVEAAYAAKKKSMTGAIKELDELVKALDKASPPDESAIAEVLHACGEILLKEGHEDKAYRYFKHASQADPKHSASQRRLWLRTNRKEQDAPKKTGLGGVFGDLFSGKKK